MGKERYLSVDWVRGLGIILVVIGHSLSYNTASGINENSLLRSILYDWIYGFHMPLMFAVSGVTFSKYIFQVTSSFEKRNVLKIH